MPLGLSIPLKGLENQSFSDVFRWYKKRPDAWNRNSCFYDPDKDEPPLVLITQEWLKVPKMFLEFLVNNSIYTEYMWSRAFNNEIMKIHYLSRK